MTIQQLKNEIVENLIAEYVAKLNFNGCVGEIFIADLAQKAYQAGREEALVEVEREIKELEIDCECGRATPEACAAFSNYCYHDGIERATSSLREKLKVNK